LAKKITWWQAAETIGISDAHATLARALRGVWRSWLFERRRGASLSQARTSSSAKNTILFVNYEDIVSGGPNQQDT
jgi:hypothetical protein